VNDPWSSAPTATRTLNGVTVNARFTNVADVHSWVALDHSRADRWTDVHTDFDSTYGVPTAVTDNRNTAVNGDDTCSLTDYVRNTTAWILATVKESRKYTMTCAAATAPGKTFVQADIISDDRTNYDGLAWGTVPTKGDATEIDTLKTWTDGTSNGGTFLT